MSPRVVSATGRDLAALQPLAEGIFGAAGRVPGWFRRKLIREAVDPTLSTLALGTGDEPIGYMLVGVGDETGVVHGAGLGLLPAWRGQGLGPALLAAASERLQAAGISAVRLLADPQHHGFYAHHDFVEVAQQYTMGAPGTGAADLDLAAHPPRPWPLPGTPHAQWFAGTWERTPASQTATLQLTDHAWVHLSREGRAILVHRLCTDADVHLPNALHALRDRFRPHTPVLLYGCDPVSCISAACLTAGWQVIQHAHVMERRFW